MSVYYVGTAADMPETMMSEVNAYLGSGHTVVLGTENADEMSPRLTVMGFLKSPCLDRMYMQCNRQSQKAGNIQTCPIAEIAVTDGRGCVVMQCSAEILDDTSVKAERWEDWMSEYHPAGVASPDYVILRFVCQSIRAMICCPASAPELHARLV